MSFVATLDNRTPFAAMHCQLPDGEGGEAVLAVVKASFAIDEQGEPQLAEEQVEVRLVDEPRGDPKLGIPRWDSDLVLAKPRVDVLVEAVAYAPRGRPTEQFFVELHVFPRRSAAEGFPRRSAAEGFPRRSAAEGFPRRSAAEGFPRRSAAEGFPRHSAAEGFPRRSAAEGSPRRSAAEGSPRRSAGHDREGESLLSKSLVVSGDRFWDGEQPSPPMPFVSMPLCWERAYGGTRSREEVDERNPVGIGYRGARSSDPKLQSQLPNIEDPGATLVHPDTPSVPAGVSTVARAWLPRRALAGTFDEGWKRRRWPLAPRDFDSAFHQSAPSDQQLDHYVAGASVRLLNMTPEGEWCFRLPSVDVPVHLLYEDRWTRAGLRVDTIEIEPELRRVVVTGRVAIAVEPRGAVLEQIVLGQVTPAWLEARRTGKCYVDLRKPSSGACNS